MTRRDVDRDLLFGLLAFQMGYVTREQYLAALSESLTASDRPIVEILASRRGVEPPVLEEIGWMIDLHLGERVEESTERPALSSWDDIATRPPSGSGDGEFGFVESYPTVPPSWVGRPGPPEAPDRGLRPGSRAGIGRARSTPRGAWARSSTPKTPSSIATWP